MHARVFESTQGQIDARAHARVDIHLFTAKILLYQTLQNTIKQITPTSLQKQNKPKQFFNFFFFQ